MFLNTLPLLLNMKLGHQGLADVKNESLPGGNSQEGRKKGECG